jgi:UDP-N-acetylglucosamine 2-epimerase (non-hydrolysing)
MSSSAKGEAVAVLLGTRPEIIKLAPIIRLLRKMRHPYFLIHTGQHYSWEMDRVFFKDLGLPEPKIQLSIRSENNLHGAHTGRMLEAIEKILIERCPKIILVQGDTNTVLAGSLAAAKIPQVKLGHVEAGLRSYDRTMPEEINRVLSDHVSDYLFAPTAGAKDILLKEGICADKIFVTGNTIVDAVTQNLEITKRRVKTGRRQFPETGSYFLMTLHRQENVDDPKRLKMILGAVGSAAKNLKSQVIFSIHPRTRKRIHEYGLRVPEAIRIIPPVGFLEFLLLEHRAAMILSDSGGLQEEACILKVPCVTLRTSTERPETVAVGANLVAGFSRQTIIRAAEKMIRSRRNWRNPFGDGKASERILDIINRH